MTEEYYEISDAPEEKKNNRTLWIILAIAAAVLLCCCCIAVLVGALSFVPIRQADQLFYNLVPLLSLV